MSARRAALALVLAIVLAAPAGASAQEGFGHERCLSNFECMRVEVPLDRSGAIPGTIPIYVERNGTGREAIFALAGGPGQGASSLTENFAADFGEVTTRGRSFIVFDQRGTGQSGALNCPELDRETGGRPIDIRAEACANRLGPRRALYTTRDSVEDMEAVRQRVGDDRIAIYGVSYGTKVALAYALRYPEHVERLVLDSVVEPQGQSPFDLDTFAAMPRALRAICRGECRGVTSDLAADVARLAERLRSGPLRGPWIDRRGRRRTVEITARGLYGLLRLGDLNPAVRAAYPSAIRSALAGDPAPLLRMEHRFDAVPVPVPPPDAVQTLSFTLFTATICEEAPLPWERTAARDERLRQANEAAAAIPDSAFAPFDRATAVALDEQSLLLQCSRWPAAAEAPALAAGPLPDVPVLVLEGEEDMRTPLEVGARVARAFPRSSLVPVPKTGHAVLGSASGARCAGIALRRFFADQAVGNPCTRARRANRVEPVLPARLGDVRPARGVPGRRGRTLAAALLTLKDVFSELEEIAFLVEPPRSGGLRGGFFSFRRGQVRLERVSLVPGVRITGRLRGIEAPAGTVRVSGRGVSAGTLTIAADGTVTGVLDRRRVRGRFRSGVSPGDDNAIAATLPR